MPGYKRVECRLLFRTTMNKLTFITGNAAKAKYLADYSHFSVEHVKLDLKEIQSLDTTEVAVDKAKRAYEILKSPVLVEDGSLVFNAMKPLPGPLIKWFYETLGNHGLVKMVDGLGDRNATSEVVFALCDETGVHPFGATMEGTIATSPRGEIGFGWDPIFIPKGHNKTWAEMSDDEKHETSMRKPALEKLSKYLSTL